MKFLWANHLFKVNLNVVPMFLASMIDVGETKDMTKKICKKLTKGSLAGESYVVLENIDENLRSIY